ncbi:hypothetical protein PENCOP_c011G01061 [Penicillium coprophilum]|uniref:Uncharacterized protein n=1 Tax=Penicillium coprophilum TaxID=36646 RepID=A0A1V6UE91_9EURO|nr:hypothetical protein PENCOP_c011G01061 [Penicillium coprophilum]
MAIWAWRKRWFVHGGIEDVDVDV